MLVFELVFLLIAYCFIGHVLYEDAIYRDDEYIVPYEDKKLLFVATYPRVISELIKKQYNELKTN